MLSRCMKEIAQSFSTDGGKTWQPQSTAFPHVNSKAVIRRLQSGNLLVIRHGQDITKATPARQELTAFLSMDEGMTWSSKLLLDERTGVSYPASPKPRTAKSTSTMTAIAPATPRSSSPASARRTCRPARSSARTPR